jgi:hypothetical protein
MLRIYNFAHDFFLFKLASSKPVAYNTDMAQTTNMA